MQSHDDGVGFQRFCCVQYHLAWFPKLNSEFRWDGQRRVARCKFLEPLQRLPPRIFPHFGDITRLRPMESFGDWNHGRNVKEAKLCLEVIGKRDG